MARRKNYSAEFKARVSLEALREEHTLSELSVKYGIHVNQLRKWKQQAASGLVDVFSRKAARQNIDREKEVDNLHAKIGRQAVELDFLRKVSALLK